MANVYEGLGVPTIINAKGAATRVSEIIAGITGAQAGMVTSGASAGLLLGTAACLARLDPARMNLLPDTEGMPDEVVVVRSQRNFHDHEDEPRVIARRVNAAPG